VGTLLCARFNCLPSTLGSPGCPPKTGHRGQKRSMDHLAETACPGRVVAHSTFSYRCTGKPLPSQSCLGGGRADLDPQEPPSGSRLAGARPAVTRMSSLRERSGIRRASRDHTRAALQPAMVPNRRVSSIQVGSTVVASTRSSGECAPRIRGPKEMASIPGSLEAITPHSRPA
jgi:hypothetical protein